MNSARSSTSCGKQTVIGMMTAFIFIFTASAQDLSNKEVLVIFNNAIPESAKLAGIYQKERNIPNTQILGFDLPVKADITRTEYETALLEPLRDRFDQRDWWSRSRDAQGLLIPTENKIRAIVLMQGVPLRIKPEPKAPEESEDSKPADPIAPRDEASVDSELAMFGIEGLPGYKGVLKNVFYDSEVPLSQANIPHLVLVTRIDSPAYVISKRMITDAVETEKHGLWGRSYIDIANKFPQGDDWLETIVSENNKHGIPTVVDRFADTLPKNYPMTDATLYYGWYDRDISGPFLNTRFQFRPGAIAIHLHSFSAEQLSNSHKNWVAPLLVRGATATVGNVYEPYLHLTHHFDILHDRLLKGWTFAEATWASIPVTSWQGVALGDPLYRPFIQFAGTGINRDEDRDFRALRAASRQWPEDQTTRREKLAGAAEQLSSGVLAEGLALDYLNAKDLVNAKLWLNKAKDLSSQPEDKLRQDIQLIAIARNEGQRQQAIAQLREAQQTYKGLSEIEALAGWLDILDPPAPPLADPTARPKN